MPDLKRTVVINTTPIISLALIGKLDLLESLYGEVLIPPAVIAEIMQRGAMRIGASEFESAGYIRVEQIRDPSRADLLSDLDRGEAEVIALAQELSADLIILDERLARRHAQRLGMSTTGVLGVLLRAKEYQLIDEIKPWIEKLIEGGIWIAEEVVYEVLTLAGER